ncbi:MAG TPA: GNAT family N-acetyltransferase [Candidatus Kapabacteria bacterium]|jgi:RimJ/RimL family protein N-acetyltransferase|nr:GNAT family N-acetyltransferase [Candidatus Kapabacteria bacterium]
MIETARLLLREYTLADVPALHRILSHATTMRFWPRPFTEANTQGWLERAVASYATNGFGRWAVILRETSEQIGDAGLMRLEVNGKSEADLGYIILANYWRQGFGLEAARAALQFGVEKGERRIVANMAHDNIASQRVAERLGMVKELEFNNTRNRDILTYLYVSRI